MSDGKGRHDKPNRLFCETGLLSISIEARAIELEHKAYVGPRMQLDAGQAGLLFDLYKLHLKHGGKKP